MDLSKLKHLNLLYAEDDYAIRESVAKSLELLCENVFVAVDGQEAIEIFDRENINIALLDYVMPKKDGYATLLHIRSHQPSLPVIILSAYTDKEKLLNAISGKVAEYLEKPIDMNKLITALLKCVDEEKHSTHQIVQLQKDIVYSFETRSLFWGHSEIHLTHAEVEILECLLKRRATLVSRETLYEQFESISDGSLRNAISSLRKKLPAELIVTKKDLGYILY